MNTSACLVCADRLLKTAEGGKFLKKQWCCIGGRVQQGNIVLSTEFIT